MAMPLYIPSLPLFQFHKVRLKVHKERTHKYTVTGFQFHKVRLKVNMITTVQ